MRAKAETGEAYDDPSEDLLFMLFEDIANGDEDFFIVERTEDRAGQTYIQVARASSGFVLEYRDGGPDRHFGTECDDMRLAHQVVTGWAFGFDGWKDDLEWKQVRF